MENTMNDDTIHLLRECSAGCKMAIDSMDHIKKQVRDKQLMLIIEKYLRAHHEIEEDCQRTIKLARQEDKEPNFWAQTFATIQARMKLLMDDDKSEAASILTDGCGMGVKSMSQYLNKYKYANEESKKLAHRLKTLEEKMIGDLQPIL